MKAQEVRCPSCSAPIPPRPPVSTCRYCGATIAIQAAAVAPTPAPRRTSVKAPVFLEDAGDNTIEVIKVVREHTGLGLHEANALVDGAPCVVADWPSDPTRMVMFFFDLVRVGARVR